MDKQLFKRYPCRIALMFVFGILAAKGIALSILFAAGIAGICICQKTAGKRKWCQLFLLLLVFSAGIVRMHAAADMITRRTAGIMDGQIVTVQGKIVKKQLQPSNEAASWIVYLTNSYLYASQKIRFCGDIILYMDLTSGRPVAGNTILVSGKIKLFRKARNEGNFDEYAYDTNQGYTCKIYADKPFTVADEKTDYLREYLYDLQQKFVQVYETHMPKEEASAICAMLLGDKSLLDNDIRQLYRKSGIAHILAISGLHISILGAAVFRLLRTSRASYPMSACLSMLLLVLFGIMTGFGLSTVRAVWMFGIYLGAACCGRAYDSMNGLAVAAVYILLRNPCALFLASFQFSFLAVAGVLFGKQICGIYRPKYKLTETLILSFCIQMLTLPLTAWYYFEIPVYSMLLNLIVLPYLSAVLVLGLAGGVFGLLLPAGAVCKWTLIGCTAFLRYFSKAGAVFLSLPGAVFVTGKPKVWQMAVYYMLLAVYAAALEKWRRKEPGKMRRLTDGNGRIRYQIAAGLPMIGCLCLLFMRFPKQSEIVMLDVGQGDGIYIRTSDGRNVMIDGGSTDVKQVGTYRILPFLKSRGIAGVDDWFLSHLDQDHISGFLEILESGYPVKEVVFSSSVVKDEAYDNVMSRLAQYGTAVRFLQKGDVLRGQKACFRCLSQSSGERINDRNAQSLVLLYEDLGYSAFFSGDISKSEELSLVKEGNIEQVTLYKAAHHGSKLSNTKQLLAKLQPFVSIVSCAKENDYGHPGEEAVKNMEQYSGTVDYTMHSGQIRIIFSKGGAVMKMYCQSR